MTAEESCVQDEFEDVVDEVEEILDFEDDDEWCDDGDDDIGLARLPPWA